jgi:hypothetical protein
MRNQIKIPVYSEGASQGITFRHREFSYAIPSYSFTDEYTQTLWAKSFAKRARKLITKNGIENVIIDVFRYRGSTQYNDRVNQRRLAKQLGSCDPLARQPFLDRIKQQTLTPDVFRYDRAIGVEIECLKPAGRQVDIPIWSRAKGDGSIRRAPNTEAVEYAILIKRSELEHRLHKFCGLISDHRVNTSCGLHIHIDCRGRTEDDVRRIAKRMTAWMIALKEFVPESRRNNTEFAELSFSETDRYRAVNFTAFRKYKTLEIRLHSGTVDYTKIIAWIRLCELLFVINVKPKARAEGVAALCQLPLTEYEKSYWLKRHQQLNPGHYSSSAPIKESE